MSKPRFCVGFADGHVRSGITERNPDMVPVVDTHTPFFFGEVVALAVDAPWARIIADALNRSTQ